MEANCPLKTSLAAIAILVLLTSQAHAQPPTTQKLPLRRLSLAHVSSSSAGVGRVVLETQNGAIGSICPSSWTAAQTTANVRVICAMLGFMNGGTRVSNTFGDGNKNFLIEGLTCDAGDSTLNDCDQAFIKSCRPEDEELSISCNAWTGGTDTWLAPSGSLQPTPGTGTWDNEPKLADASNMWLNGSENGCPSDKIRLLSSTLSTISGSGNGYVQVKNPVSGEFEYVCDDKWTEADAMVVCAELCYAPVAKFTARPGVLADSVVYPQNGLRGVTAYDCDGTETNLDQCTSYNNGNCVPGVSAIAGIQCLPAHYPSLDNEPMVTCGGGALKVDFPTSEFPPLDSSNVFFSDNPPQDCVMINKNAGGLSVSIEADTTHCGTMISNNGTHITYSANVQVIWTNGPVFDKYYNHRYEVSCSLPINDIVTNRYQPYTKSPLTKLEGEFNVSLRLELYENNEFKKPLAGVGGTYLVEVGSWINAAVVMDNNGNHLKVVINECNAHSSMPVNTLGKTEALIQSKCAQRTSLAMYPLDDYREGFRFKAFEFAGYSLVYLECKVTICMASSTDPACDRSCGTPVIGRRKRQAELTFMTETAVSHSIVFYNQSTPEVREAVGNLQQNVLLASSGNGNGAGHLHTISYGYFVSAAIVLLMTLAMIN